MADFISKQLQKQTISPETYDSKIKLDKNEVRLSFLEAKDTGGSFKLIYLVQVNPKGRKLDPKKKLSPATIDMESLREGILSDIPAFDKKYLILKKFDDRKAFFEFDYEEWLKKATRGIKPKTSFSKFDREFKFRVPPPGEIRKDRLSIRFEEFITRKFLSWLDDNRTQEKKFFEYLIPKREQRKLRVRFHNMFDWHYDSQWNKMVAKLKTVYIVALLYATGAIVKKMSQRNINKSKKELFSTKVEKNIQKFDKKKWEDFTRNKFF